MTDDIHRRLAERLGPEADEPPTKEDRVQRLAAERLRERGHFVWEDDLVWWTEGEDAAVRLDGCTDYPSALLAALEVSDD